MLTPTENLEVYLKNDRRNLKSIDHPGVHFLLDSDAKLLKSVALDMLLHWRQAKTLNNPDLIRLAEENIDDLCTFAHGWGY